MECLWAAETAAESGGGGYWQLAMILAGIGFLGLFARWRRARRSPVVNTRELRSRDQEPNRYRDTADRAIVELLETSRALNAQVDTKIRMLNRLVKDAEDCCARLEKLLAIAADDGAAESRREPPPTDPAPVKETGPEFVSELHERIHRLRLEGKSVAEIAKATNLSTTEVVFAIESMEPHSGGGRG